MRNLFAIGALVAAACAASTTAAPEAPRRSSKEAEKEARALIDEAYQGLRGGDVSGNMALFAPDLFFVGPGPAEVGLDRAAALALGSDVIDARAKHKLKSFALEVFAGPDGHSAYVIDQIDYDGTSFAVAAIAAENDGLWTLTTVHLARAVSVKRLDSAATLGELPRWRPERDDASHTEAPREMADALRLALDDVDARLKQFGKSKEAAFVGPSPDEVLVGAKAIGKKWKKRAPTWKLDDAIAGATPDGGLVWIVGNAVDSSEPAERRGDAEDRRRKRRPDDDRQPAPEPTPAPRRVFAIYRDDGGDGGWSLALLQVGVALARP